MHLYKTSTAEDALSSCSGDKNMGVQEETRYINELEAALQQKLFEEFPDTEWLVQTLLGFLKGYPKEENDAGSL